MNWKGMHAWAKCKVKFGSDQNHSAAMMEFAPGAAHDSCSVVQSVLAEFIHPDGALAYTAVKRDDLGVVDAQDAVKKVGELLDGDNVVYIHIQNNHYFTIIPLSATEIALLQGFQGSYNLTQWMQAKNNGVMQKSIFMMNFFMLFYGENEASMDAAKALFSIPGKDGDIVSWFHAKIRLAKVSSIAL